MQQTKDVLSHVTKSPEAWFPQIGRDNTGRNRLCNLSLGLLPRHAIYNLSWTLPWTIQHDVQPPGGSEAAFKDLATLSMGNIVLVDDQRANFQSQFGAAWRKGMGGTHDMMTS